MKSLDGFKRRVRQSFMQSSAESTNYVARPQRNRALYSAYTRLVQLVLFAIFFLSSCTQDTDLALLQQNSAKGKERHIVGLASPIPMGLDSTVIDLADYVIDPTVIDSIRPDFLCSSRQDGNVLTVIPLSMTPPMNEVRSMNVLSIFIDGEELAIPMKRSLKQRHRFVYPDPQTGQATGFKSELTNWSHERLGYSKEDKGYFIDLIAEPGRYQYKMVRAGQEIDDEYNPESTSNGMGGTNNVLTIGSPSTGLELSALELASKDGLAIGVTPQGATRTVVFLDNKHIDTDHFVDGSGSIGYADLDAPAGRSHLRAWSMDENSLSNELLIPLQDGRPITDPSLLKREDLHAMSMYNVFIDRFHNGDKTNDRPVGEPAVLPIADNMGGDIKGAIQKLEEGYFKSLGINTIWISPVVENVEGAWGKWPDPETAFSGYHGYWPISFTQVDERLTTESDLHELVEKAHAADMNVILDFVANHVHEDHPYYVADTTVATDMILPDGRRNLELWDEQRLTTWFDTFLPSLRLDEPRVYEMMTDSAVYWIDKYDLDGFRHDAAKHVPEIFWKTLTRKLKERVIIPKGKPLYQVGETYGSHELVASYVNSGQLDAQFDFNAYDALVNALATEEGSFVEMDAAIHKSLQYFGDHHLMGNITGNQDKARFISYAGGALGFDEKPKVAGWTREVGVGEEVAYDKLEQLIVLTATLPGVPVIYYGDEIGSYGAGDPDNRKMMRFEGLAEKEQGVKQTASELLKLRRASMPLMYGDFKTIEVSDDVYVFSRSYLGETVIVGLNRSATEVKVSVPKEMTIAKHSFEIMTLH